MSECGNIHAALRPVMYAALYSLSLFCFNKIVELIAHSNELCRWGMLKGLAVG